jgi:hypothetical protein
MILLKVASIASSRPSNEGHTTGWACYGKDLCYPRSNRVGVCHPRYVSTRLILRDILRQGHRFAISVPYELSILLKYIENRYITTSLKTSKVIDFKIYRQKYICTKYRRPLLRLRDQRNFSVSFWQYIPRLFSVHRIIPITGIPVITCSPYFSLPVSRTRK